MQNAYALVTHPDPQDVQLADADANNEPIIAWCEKKPKTRRTQVMKSPPTLHLQLSRALLAALRGRFDLRAFSAHGHAK